MSTETSRGNPFETETMAELCLRQGHRGEGISIYRRLIARAPDEPTRTRLGARLSAIETNQSSATPPPPASPAALTEPGLRTRTTGDALSVEWKLPPALPRPRTLELLLVVRTHAGVTTETRSLPLDADSGRFDLQIPGLHSARAAAGHHRDNRFIPSLRA